MVSGVGVVDKSVAILGALAEVDGPCSLAELVDRTGISRATAHRLAVALEVHGLVRRDEAGGFALGGRLVELGRAAAGRWPWADRARPVVAALRDATGESAQLYVRDGAERLCLVSLESAQELRTTVPEGARLPLGVGSAGRILVGEAVPADGWVASIGERSPGVGSVSAPVLGPDGSPIGAVGISGPLHRLGPEPGRRFGAAVVAAARRIESAG